MSDPSQLTASVLAAEQRLGSRSLAWDAVLATVATAHGLAPEAGAAPEPGPELDATLQDWRDPAALEHLAPTHEALVAGRQASGTFYTPTGLGEWILDRLPDDPGARVLDPTCGAGHLLLARARRLVARGVPAQEAVTLVHGVDLDPVAVAIARLRLRALAPDADPTTLDVRVGDGLHPHPGAPYDAVIGNPPFLGRLRGRLPATPVGEPVAAPAAVPAAPTPRVGPYTDLSGLFLRHALTLVRPGGTVALVQPLSLLAARDAAPVREAVVAAGAVTAFWSSLQPVFPGTAVLTCVPVVTTGVPQKRVPTWAGPDFADAGEQVLPEHEWGLVAAAAAAIPAVAPRTDGTLGDLGRCTADFRDQYYGLVPFVGESPRTPGHARLVTAGLIDPAECRWGETSTRFAKTRYDAPGVDLAALHTDGTLSAWARARLVPKLLVATQGRVIEAVVDETGEWLPSVPVLTVVAEPARLWHLLAVLLAPPVVATAAARYLGTALAPGAIKLSARQVAAIPLPADLEAWDRGAAAARSAQFADPADRREHLVACAEAMCAAYDDDGALAWWTARLRPA